MARDRPEERECVLTIQRGAATRQLDLRVRAAPLELGDVRFTLVTMLDVTADRRRAALQRAFTQDVASLVWDVCRASASLCAAGADGPAAAAEVRGLATWLGREVQLQQALVAEPPGEVHAGLEEVAVVDVMDRLAHRCAVHPAAAGKRLVAPPALEGMALDTDPFLLDRALAALLLNALEATPPGGDVRLEVEATPARVTFRLWNAGVIPASVVPHLFQRYCTTRPGEGRGQGAWLARWLGEQRLHGRLTVATSIADGTAFELSLPRVVDGPPPAA